MVASVAFGWLAQVQGSVLAVQLLGASRPESPCHGANRYESGGLKWLEVIAGCVVGVVDYTPKSVIVNDPYGDLDLVSGVYGSRDGAGLQYGRKNFGRRWMVDETNQYAYAPGRAWAIIVESVLS